MTTLHFENGTTQEQDIEFSDKDSMQTYCTKMFLRRWPSRLISITASIRIQYKLVLNDEGEVMMEGENISTALQGSSPTAIAAPVTHGTQRAPEPIVDPTPRVINPPAPAVSPDDPEVAMTALSGGRKRLSEEMQKRLGETMFEPHPEERKRGVSLVAFYHEPIPYVYAPMSNVAIGSLQIGELILAIGYTKQANSTMFFCRTRTGHVALVNEVDINAAPLTNKRQATGNPKAPDSVPLQHMADTPGNFFAVADLSGESVESGKATPDQIPDRIPLQRQ